MIISLKVWSNSCKNLITDNKTAVICKAPLPNLSLILLYISDVLYVVVIKENLDYLKNLWCETSVIYSLRDRLLVTCNRGDAATIS
jgi:hypothetical protein